jgi:hypothetical protein
VTGPLPVGADVVVTIVGRVEYADEKIVSVVTGFGGTLTAPLTAGVVVTVVPSQQGPPTDAQLARLWEMGGATPGTVSTGLMDQGPAGEPAGGSGEGGIAATTRALPVGPDLQTGKEPSRPVGLGRLLNYVADRMAGDVPLAEVEWTGADEGEWLRRMDGYSIDTAGATFGCAPSQSTQDGDPHCPGHQPHDGAEEPDYCDGACVGRGPEPF